MIRLENVTCGYGDKLPIRNLSAAFPQKGCVAVLGASGSGKSTLIKLLAGLIKPVEGTITGLTKLKIAVVFQEDRLLPWYTVRQNVAIPNPEGDALGAITDMELEDYAGKPPNELSGGMQRRTAIARALCFGGGILLLDEPFKGLDDELKRRVTERMRGRFPLTIIATHDAEEARALAGDDGFMELWCGV